MASRAGENIEKKDDTQRINWFLGVFPAHEYTKPGARGNKINIHIQDRRWGIYSPAQSGQRALG